MDFGGAEQANCGSGKGSRALHYRTLTPHRLPFNWPTTSLSPLYARRQWQENEGKGVGGNKANNRTGQFLNYTLLTYIQYKQASRIIVKINVLFIVFIYGQSAKVQASPALCPSLAL
ncbi:unnamed protein product [Ceratitis capitata]|uniref:(Mediterranean fruit fly) hypothetical protein n=1 Tax=Ceratitis capitata TaxID=7213 RepID=A0A811UQH2_CERCA|nr:unnamed protein product [Ceratitis capitata]